MVMLMRCSVEYGSVDGVLVACWDQTLTTFRAFCGAGKSGHI